MTAATITATNLKLTLTLQDKRPDKPSLGADGRHFVHVTNATTTTTDTNGTKNTQPQKNSGDDTPDLFIHPPTATNTIEWALAKATLATGVTTPPPWWNDTYIMGIVVQAARASQSNNQGGASFTAVAPAVYRSSPWAGPHGVTPGNSLTPYLLLAPTNTTFKLTVATSSRTIEGVDVVSSFYDASKAVKLPGEPDKTILDFSFDYRVYFYTKDLGVWYVDPMFDVRPVSP